LQIQTVLYQNEPYSLKRSLDSIENAIRVNREGAQELGEVCVFWGDASPSPIFDDAEIEALGARYRDSFKLIYRFFNENTGTSRGHNKMGLDAQSDFLLVMNPDVILCPRFFSPMLQTLLDETKSAGIAEARQTPLEHPKTYDRETLETPWSTGACFMIPTELYRSLGGFDEATFFLYCDDVDLSWRVRLAGKKLYYRPDCVVFHSKFLSATGEWSPTEAEELSTREAAILMAYKYSDNARVEAICAQYRNSPIVYERRAVELFEERRASGRLPEQIDLAHLVADFSHPCFTQYSDNKYDA
jgi:GT2 family glycosyltransferase